LTDPIEVEAPAAPPPAAPRRRRRVWWILVALVVVLAGSAGGALLWLDELALEVIERAGTQVLGVETRLDTLAIAPVSGHIRLGGLSVDNPAGFREPKLVTLRSCDLRIDRRTLLTDEIVAPELTIEGLTMSLERNEQGANYEIVLANLAAEEEAEAKGEVEEPGPRFVIRELVIRDVEVRSQVNLGVAKPIVPLQVPEIRLRNVGAEDQEPLTVGRLISLILKTTLVSVLQVGQGILPDAISDGLAKGLGGLVDVGGFAVDVVGAGGKTVVGIVGGGGKLISSGLGALFGRKGETEKDAKEEDPPPDGD